MTHRAMFCVFVFVYVEGWGGQYHCDTLIGAVMCVCGGGGACVYGRPCFLCVVGGQGDTLEGGQGDTLEIRLQGDPEQQ